MNEWHPRTQALINNGDKFFLFFVLCIFSFSIYITHWWVHLPTCWKSNVYSMSFQVILSLWIIRKMPSRTYTYKRHTDLLSCFLLLFCLSVCFSFLSTVFPLRWTNIRERFFFLNLRRRKLTVNINTRDLKSYEMLNCWMHKRDLGFRIF